MRPSRRIPSRLGGWDLVECVSEGCLTHVYRARPSEGGSDRPAAYAVKALRPEREHDAQAIEMLAREALVGRRVAHPHLVPVLAASIRTTPPYLVMPWLEGQALDLRLRRTIGPDIPEILWIARQVTEALGALHEQG
ncbi:MAG: protein kinase, partial [Patescibacteria group bacterium]|nr:protein kinase [Patescibacteria group bacterium]